MSFEPATVAPNPDHPAKYSPEVLMAMRPLVRAERERLARPPRLLDPYAGVGRIHQLAKLAAVTAVEIEPEWAACHPDTLVGDSTAMPESWRHRFDIIATSPTYANRMADHHTPGAKPRNGKPPDTSKRFGYRFQLGRMPTEGSTSTLGWVGQEGSEYRRLHQAAMLEWSRVLMPSSPAGSDGGLLLLNLKNHERDKRLQPVVEWWLAQLLGRRWWLVAAWPVETAGMGNGANREARADNELLLVLRAPNEGGLPL